VLVHETYRLSSIIDDLLLLFPGSIPAGSASNLSPTDLTHLVENVRG